MMQELMEFTKCSSLRSKFPRVHETRNKSTLRLVSSTARSTDSTTGEDKERAN